MPVRLLRHPLGFPFLHPVDRLLSLMGLAVLTCAVLGSAKAGHAAESLEVARGSVSPRLVLTGELVAGESVTLVAPSVGIFPLTLQWIVDDGVTVAAGDIIAEFDNQQLASQLDDVVSRVDEVRSGLESIAARVDMDVEDARFTVASRRAALERAALDADVPSDLLAQEVWQERQLAKAKAAAELAAAEESLRSAESAGRAEISIERLALETAEAERRRVEEGLERLTLRAPRPGVVVLRESMRSSRTLREGDSVFPSNSVAEIPDLESLEVSARLFDVDDGRLQVGDEVTVWLDAYPDRQFKGRVETIEGIAREVTSTSTRRGFDVRIALEGLEPGLRPGLSVRVEHSTLIEGLVAPRAALAPGVAGAGRARLASGRWADVTLGPCDGSACLVESGLEEGTALAPVPTGEPLSDASSAATAEADR